MGQQTRYSHRISNDIFLDPCKADGFVADIALPNEELVRELTLQNLLDDALEQQPSPLELDALLSDQPLTVVAANLSIGLTATATAGPHHHKDPRRHRRKGSRKQRGKKKHKHGKRRRKDEDTLSTATTEKLREGMGAAGRRALRRAR